MLPKKNKLFIFVQNFGVFASIFTYSSMIASLKSIFIKIDKNQNTESTICYFLLAVLILVSYMLSPFNVELDPDATCYMGATRLILEGKVPLVDFKIDYTPLVMYLMCLPVSIFGASYPVGMITTYLVQLYNAFVVYRISLRTKISPSQALLCSLHFLVCCLFLGGRQFLLEPYVLAFGLTALLLVFSERKLSAVFAGVLCFGAFWSKQYGLGFLPLSLLLPFLNSNSISDKIKQCICVIGGFIVAAFICIVSWLSMGVSVSDIVSFLHTDYESAGFSGLVHSYATLFTFFPSHIVAIFVIFRHPEILKKYPALILCLFGIVGFMLQGWFRYNYHYLMLVAPFAILSIIGLYAQLEHGLLKRVFAAFLAFSIILPSIVDIRKNIVIFTSGKRERREMCAEEVAKFIPVGSLDVFTSCNVLSLTLQNNYYPPLLREYGMSNGFIMDPYKSIELIEASAYCIIACCDYSDDGLFPPSTKDYFTHYFNNVLVDLPGNDSDCIVFIRK